jgi:cystathionine beta-lyase/cystathionine gamma-synthase
MLRHYQPPNLTIMDAIQRKELLHLRIEQANEEMQIVLAKMVEVLFQTYQPEVIEEPTEQEKAVDYSSLVRMTSKEMKAELEAGVAEYERGEYITAAESKAAAATW